MTTRFPGWLFLRNLVERRSLLFHLVRRDFEQRFIGSAMGWIWGLIHPLVLGSGRHLFSNSGSNPCAFELVGSATTGTGVIIATYQPAGS